MSDEVEMLKEVKIGNMDFLVKEGPGGHRVVTSPDISATIGGVEVRPTVGGRIRRREDGKKEVTVTIGIEIPFD